MTDIRPANCRFRLQDEGKSYPRSSCNACGKNIMSGLGKACTVAQDQRPALLPHEVNEFLSMVANGPQLGKTYAGELNRFITKARWVKANFKENELPADVKELVATVGNGPEWGTSINHSINLYMKMAIQLRSNYSGKSQKVAPLPVPPSDDEIIEVLERITSWVQASLRCPNHPWDVDQRAVAEIDVEHALNYLKSKVDEPAKPE